MSLKDNKELYLEINGKKYVNRGDTSFPNGEIEKYYIEVRPAKNFGEFDCKYCKKTVQPILSGVWQIICSKCGYGLTPDFFTKEELRYFIKTGEELDVETDGNDKLKEKRNFALKKFKEKQEKQTRIKMGNITYIIG